MPSVFIPTTMRKYTNGERALDVAGGTVADLFDRLEERFPNIRAQIWGEDGQLKPFIAVFVNGNDIRTLDGTATPLRENDEVQIIPAMAGG